LIDPSLERILRRYFNKYLFQLNIINIFGN